MDFKSFAIKNILMSFFVVSTCVCIVMAVLGMVFEPDASFGYEAFLSPLIFGAATTLPSLVGYSKRELTIRGAIVRKLFELVLIELIVFFLISSSGKPISGSLAVSQVLSVLLVFVAVHIVFWISDQKTAKSFNVALKEMQKRNEQVS